jgi:hypothetical protein
MYTKICKEKLGGKMPKYQPKHFCAAEHWRVLATSPNGLFGNLMGAVE